MQKYLLLSLLLVLNNYLFSQTQFLIKPSNPFYFTPESSWEFDVVNPHDKDFQMKAFSQIINSNNQVIIELESEPININKGYNIFSANNIQTLRIFYKDLSYSSFVSATGKLPNGNYKVCLRFQCITSDCSGIGFGILPNEPNYCKEVFVAIPTPLLLAYPLHKSEISETRPLFTWIPPMPIGGQVPLNYSFKLVEKREGQSELDAIKRNRPLIQNPSVESTSYFYPPDLEDLESNKNYVWQVEAWLGKLHIATSEIWEFKIKEKDSMIEIINFSQSFIEIEKQDGNTIYTIAEEIKLRLNSRTSNGFIEYGIYDENEKQISKNVKINTSLGDNRIVIKASEIQGIINEETYTMLIVLNNKTTYKIRFLYFDIDKAKGAEVIRKLKSEDSKINE